MIWIKPSTVRYTVFHLYSQLMQMIKHWHVQLTAYLYNITLGKLTFNAIDVMYFNLSNYGQLRNILCICEKKLRKTRSNRYLPEDQVGDGEIIQTRRCSMKMHHPEFWNMNKEQPNTTTQRSNHETRRSPHGPVPVIRLSNKLFVLALSRTVSWGLVWWLSRGHAGIVCNADRRETACALIFKSVFR